MSVSIGNGVDLGNLVTSTTNPLTGVVEISAGGTPVILESSVQSAVQVILVPSGTFNDTQGAFTLGTALSSIPSSVTSDGGNAIVYLPANAGGLSAGLYSALFSSTTQGVLVGPVATTATAWTQTTGIVPLASIPIPGMALGNSGSIELELNTSNNNSAAAKTFRAGLNQTTGALTLVSTTVTGSRSLLTVQNRGSEGKQFSSSGSGSLGIITAGVPWSVDTTQNWAITISCQLAASTDWTIIECFKLKLLRGN